MPETLTELCNKDAYSVMPPQPLGDYLTAIVETLKDFDAKITRAEDSQVKIEQLEKTVAELRSQDADRRIRALEHDLLRPGPTSRQSNPVAMTLDVNLSRFISLGGQDNFKSGVANILGLKKSDIQVLSRPIDDSGNTIINFRVAFMGPNREHAETLAKSLSGKAGSVGGMTIKEVTRPEPHLIGVGEPRVGHNRHGVGKTVAAMLNTMSTTLGRLSDAEFWILHARQYFRKLRKYKKKRYSLPAVEAFLTSNKRILGAIYWRKLSKYPSHKKSQERKKRALKYLLTATDNGARKAALDKALTWLDAKKAANKKELSQRRAIEYLMARSDLGIRRFAFGKLFRFMELRRAIKRKGGIADNLLILTNRGMRKYCFSTLRAFAAKRKARRGLVDSLAVLNNGALRSKYIRKLRLFTKWRRNRRRQRTAVAALELLSENTIRKSYFECLTDFVRRRRREADDRKKKHLKAKLADQLGGKTAKKCAKRCFDKLKNYARLKNKSKDKKMMEKIMAYLDSDSQYDDIVKRCDTLGTQVDVGLKTLTNTNSVLNKLVDRLISVDEQLDHLDKDKVSRKEIGSARMGPSQAPSRAASPTPILERRDVSPPRRHLAAGPSPSTPIHVPTTTPLVVPQSSTAAAAPRDKEAEQMFLLQKERANLDRLKEMERWHSSSPNDFNLPSAEDTLSRARQWQRDRQFAKSDWSTSGK
eukprot:TRINITY_DN4083_c2_g1_i1.p1 TRINITY_DN4083_c2_g1~~TRINITY_DN4083_c2_g1_i1.p1  ORF type:complete len:715 (+),score=158.50 TRINITY_DN4083_c2_g1_i1:42-2147(+)